MSFRLENKYPLLHSSHHDVGGGGGGSGKEGYILVKNIPMVEGKMSFEILYEINELSKRVVKRVKLIVEEPLRNFEAICEGKAAEEIAIIVQRICGVCPFPYALASVKAVERAFGHKVSELTHRLRELALYGNMFNSHVLHAVDLTMPKLLHLNDVIALALNTGLPPWIGEIPLSDEFFAQLTIVQAQIADGKLETASPEVTALARVLLGLHELGNDLAKLVGGRAVHATTLTPGRMTSVPNREELVAIRDRLAGAHKAYDMLVAVYKQAALAGNPNLPIREREFIAVRGTKKYPFYGGLIGSSKRGTMTAAEFEQYKHEYVVDNSNSKQVYTDESSSYMVGALARLNINWDLLSEEARKDAELLGFSMPCYDPFMNTAAQVVEGRQVLIDVVKAIDEILALDLETEKHDNRAPWSDPSQEDEVYGAGYLEAPRGLIWHEYRYRKGLCTWANCIIPTGMNTGSMQADLEHFAEHLMNNGYGDDDIAFILELLLTHYDPCNSCAVHLVNLLKKVKETVCAKIAKFAKHAYASFRNSVAKGGASVLRKEPTLSSTARVAVVSLGNSLSGDYGIGDAVVEEIKAHGVFGNIDFIHAGVESLDLFRILGKENYEAIVFVDAVNGLNHVGETVRFTGGELLKRAKVPGRKMSLHDTEFVYSLGVANAMGYSIPERVLFYGVQAGQTKTGMGLTSSINTHKIAHVIIDDIEDLYFD